MPCPCHQSRGTAASFCHRLCAGLRASSGLWDLLFSCNFLCNASESAAKSFSGSNNVSLSKLLGISPPYL